MLPNVPADAMGVVSLVLAIKADARIEHRPDESMLLIKPDGHQIRIFYGGLPSTQKQFRGLFLGEVPLKEGHVVPVLPPELVPLVENLSKLQFELIRVVNDGRPDFLETAPLFGNVLVYRRDDLIVMVGWRSPR